MNRIEKMVAWLLTGTLALVAVLGALSFIAAPNVLNALALIYYLVVVVIICPKTPLDLNIRLIYAFVSFFVGMFLGLV